jgi:hypothetical protein
MTVVWAHILNRNAPELDTIQTWTCRYMNSADAPSTGIPGKLSNDSFKSMCQESKFALYGTLVVFLLLGVSMVVTMVTWLADKWAARQARKAYGEGAETISMSTKA